MPRAIVYARVSSDEQAASGLGIEAQAHSCRQWAERDGREVVGPFRDEAIGGATSLDSRPGLLDAVSLLEPGDVLLVAKRDRLGRDPMVIAMIESVVQRKKCRIASAAGEGTEGDDPQNVLMRRLVDAFAEHERLLIKFRTRAALAAKRRRGERTGTVPFGSDLADDGQSLVPNDRERAVIGRIRAWRDEGRSLRWIARELDRLGVRPKTGKPRWSHTTIVRLLQRGAA